MKLCTASETISFLRELEEQEAKFFEVIARKYSKEQELWQSFAKESRKYANQIQMAYQSVITDAIEGCYAFELESEDHTLDTELRDSAGYTDAVAQAVAVEEKILAFYHTAADQSMSLLADVPRNMKIVARKRTERVERLKSLN